MASDMFIKIDGIEGESTDSGFEKQIEMTSYSHGISMPTNVQVSTSGNLAHGRVDHQNFNFTKTMDKSSPKLINSCNNGRNIKTITATFNRADESKSKYMEMVMTDCIVSSYSVGGGQGGGIPTESVSIAYSKIKWTYTLPGSDSQKGAIPAEWDLATNKGG